MGTTEDGNMETTSYEVRVVGQLWWGGTAATSYTVREPMEYPQGDDETAVQYECRMVECAAETGDFQCVDAVEIVRTSTVVDGGKVVTTTETTQPFDDEAEMVYFDCMYGSEV